MYFIWHGLYNNHFVTKEVTEEKLFDNFCIAKMDSSLGFVISMSCHKVNKCRSEMEHGVSTCLAFFYLVLASRQWKWKISI